MVRKPKIIGIVFMGKRMYKANAGLVITVAILAAIAIRLQFKSFGRQEEFPQKLIDRDQL
jgi:hypothetical protein